MPTLTTLTDFPVFGDLTREQLMLLDATARDVRHRAGELLFTEGAPAWGCWLITSGEVELETGAPGGGRLVIDTLGPGDVLGWSWLVAPHHWHHTAKARTDVTAVLLDTDRLKNFAATDPGLGYAVTKALFGVLLSRLQATRARLAGGA
ncbi:hypothetical protein Afil01_29000 [Actinorhabdospora filicis]|uniref:Cyclic nucleotide-binding domain-containing protein n=1 Tax=Actinorhabdospora filicis TaxID=1785913 RepID=A0A9W6SKU7_9ACTN|nr:cyclic nucleotide-binding domain-containing protein [Actinorhabdospora filicis]GLZ78093.1 hypothetical protein Afil01_29000 [Actinorhabdospora filicis]